MLETYMKLCVTELDFPEKNFLPKKNSKMSQKWAKNSVF